MTWQNILLIVILSLIGIQGIFTIIFGIHESEEILGIIILLNPIYLICFLIASTIKFIIKWIKNDIYIRYTKENDYFISYNLQDHKFYKITDKQFDEDYDKHSLKDRIFEHPRGMYEHLEELRKVLHIGKRKVVRLLKGTDDFLCCPTKLLNKFELYTKEIE